MKAIWAAAALGASMAAMPAQAQHYDDDSAPTYYFAPPRAPLHTAPTGIEQSGAECQAKWNAADRNGDGVLTGRELSAARPLVPIPLSSQRYVTHQEFISACQDAVSRKHE